MFMGKIRKQNTLCQVSIEIIFLYVSSIYIALQAEGLPRLLSKAFLEMILSKKNDISGQGQALGFTNSGNLWAGKIFILSCCPLSLSRLAELLLHQVCLIFIRVFVFFLTFKKSITYMVHSLESINRYTVKRLSHTRPHAPNR